MAMAEDDLLYSEMPERLVGETALGFAHSLAPVIID